jgi:hypothetical protein
MDERSRLVKLKVENHRPGKKTWTAAKMLSTTKPVPKSFVMDAIIDKDEFKAINDGPKAIE